MERDFGEVYDKNGIEIKLTNEPYPAGGSFPVDDPEGAMYSGNWYEAHGEDEDENEYLIYWVNVDWSDEDASDACDWDNPDYIRKI